jgi:hypothetical protein
MYETMNTEYHLEDKKDMTIDSMFQDAETTEKSFINQGAKHEGCSSGVDEPRELSTRIVPRLESRLRETGLLTAIVTVDSPRFRHYLKKPANLLHDRWAYSARGQDRSVLYRLGIERSLHQNLTISPLAGVAILDTCDPLTGSLQSIVVDLHEKRVLSNTVTHESDDTPAYNFFALNRREGSLEVIVPPDEEEPDSSELRADQNSRHQEMSTREAHQAV